MEAQEAWRRRLRGHMPLWREWICPGNPEVWSWLQSRQPQCLEEMRRLHPADVFPRHFLHSRPPGMEHLPLQHIPGLQAPAVLPTLRPAAPQPVDAVAPQPEQRQQQQQQPQQQPQQPLAPQQPQQQEQQPQVPAVQPQVPAAQLMDANMDEQLCGMFEEESSEDVCCCDCSDCCRDSDRSSYDCGYTTSPESERRQPGKRITWRGAIAHAGAPPGRVGR